MSEIDESLKNLEQQFINWLKDSKKLSDNTCRNYTNRLKNKIPEKLNELQYKQNNSSLYTYRIEELQKINDLFDRNEYGLKDWNRTATIGQEAWNALKYLIEYKTGNINKSNEGKPKMPNDTKQIQPLNQILYGPPGTGKTYHTINKALEVIDGNVPENREEAKEKFEEYRKSGQIEFVTFHQSYGYEEFVEGIKAIPAGKEGNEEGEEMIYDVVDGAFKKLINRVIDKSIFIRQYNKSQIDSINFKSYIQLEECNNTIDVGDFIFIHNLGEQTICKTFIAKSKCGNDKKVQVELLSDNSNFKFDKKLIEPYFEKLEDKNAYVDLYELINEFIPKIIIIDEINRGNISKIFGELITLIEPSKRIGAEEALHVKLPYSNESFGVPSNLYIIGTMNTADRSIALMDTALRRRFDFQEMMPRPGLLDFTVDGLHVKRMLETINKRIEYLYDRDHTIGHAYFMELKDGNKQNLETLSNIFKNKIIPLLQEYFYDDWEKIRLVLGDNQKTGENEQCQFIKIKKDYDVKKLFGNTSHEFLDDEETKIYEINDDAFGKIESYIRIYE